MTTTEALQLIDTDPEFTALQRCELRRSAAVLLQAARLGCQRGTIRALESLCQWRWAVAVLGDINPDAVAVPPEHRNADRARQIVEAHLSHLSLTEETLPHVRK